MNRGGVVDSISLVAFFLLPSRVCRLSYILLSSMVISCLALSQAGMASLHACHASCPAVCVPATLSHCASPCLLASFLAWPMAWGIPVSTSFCIGSYMCYSNLLIGTGWDLFHCFLAFSCAFSSLQNSRPLFMYHAFYLPLPPYPHIAMPVSLERHARGAPLLSPASPLYYKLPLLCLCLSSLSLVSMCHFFAAVGICFLQHATPMTLLFLHLSSLSSVSQPAFGQTRCSLAWLGRGYSLNRHFIPTLHLWHVVTL